jgi:hypothetical protein
MESIKELKEEIRKLTIEKEQLEDRVLRLEKTRRQEESKVEEADIILKMIPQDSATRDMFNEFYKSKEELNVQEYISDTSLQKFISNSDKFVIDDDNNILLANLHIGTVTDDRFKKFLLKTVKILPFLVRLYSRYLGFTELCSTINNFEYFGKKFFTSMENRKGKEV